MVSTIKLEVNGRITELLASTRAAAFAEDVEHGRKQTRPTGHG
jgi:hypothetical protein